MKIRKAAAALLAAGAIAITVGAPAPAGAQAADQTIVEIAASNPDFSTLVTAVTEAGLVETLSGPGPFTVFAPTNDAFAALPAGTLDSLLADPEGALTDILLLHVVSGAVDSEAAIAAAGGTVDTLGGPVSVELRGSDLFVGGAKVITTDIQASNGIIHVIDTVITAPAEAVDTPSPATPTAGNGPTPVGGVQTGAGGTAGGGDSNVLPLVALVGLSLAAGAGFFGLRRKADAV
jgi:uncharacterized surface protein with fasciclin (FAS1) repeats